MKDPKDLPRDQLIALSNSVVDQIVSAAIDHIKNQGMLYSAMMSSNIQQDAISAIKAREPILVAKAMFAEVGLKVCLMKIAEQIDEESKDDGQAD